MAQTCCYNEATTELANEEYFRRMAVPGKWGDVVMLSCACHMYGRTTEVVMASNKRIIPFVPAGFECDTQLMDRLCLGYIPQMSHYVFLQLKSKALHYRQFVYCTFIYFS
jgi:hypothetical protein